MKTVDELTSENYLFRVKIADLEKQLERKDEMQILEMQMLRDQLSNIIKSYKLD